MTSSSSSSSLLQSHGYCSAVVTKYRTKHIRGKKVTIVKKKQLASLKHNLLANSGRDAMHALVYTNTAAGTRGFGFIGVTQSTISPGAGDTVLSGEETTNGLGRADAVTKTHTGGTNSTLIEHTFTASGSFTSVLASATFVAASAGVMAHIANFTTGSGTLISGDTLKVSWTCNLG